MPIITSTTTRIRMAAQFKAARESPGSASLKNIDFFTWIRTPHTTMRALLSQTKVYPKIDYTFPDLLIALSCSTQSPSTGAYHILLQVFTDVSFPGHAVACFSCWGVQTPRDLHRWSGYATWEPAVSGGRSKWYVTYSSPSWIRDKYTIHNTPLLHTENNWKRLLLQPGPRRPLHTDTHMYSEKQFLSPAENS